MEAFARLLDRLYFTTGTRAKSEIVQDYLRHTPDPDRGWAIAAIAGTLRFDLFKRPLIKELMLQRVDPELYAMCYDYIGESSETIAHLWPDAEKTETSLDLPGLDTLIRNFRSGTRAEIARQLAFWLDHMSPNQRWALLKLGTRGLRIGVSERLAKRILAEYGGVPVEELELLWHGLEPPYTDLLQWLEGHGPRPDISDRLVFQPVMLAHPLEESDLDGISPDAWQAEWKLDGIRVQFTRHREQAGLFTRNGDNISGSFPDLVDALHEVAATLDGELLVYRDGQPGSFNDLQQRLNRKRPGRRLQQDYPVGILAYDLLKANGEDLRTLPLSERRQRLEEWYQILKSQHPDIPLHLSPTLSFSTLDDLHALRSAAETTNGHVEGLMLKRLDSLYVPGRPKGLWFKWKRRPKVVDAVLMYAQRGHGKRSSYYSDYTFGLWQDEQLLPIGKAYSGFTDDELKKLDRWVRHHTIGRFGPVREVEKALVLEVAFDSAHTSKRHKSGVALRFPRIHRIRWDKPVQEADALSSLSAFLP